MLHLKNWTQTYLLVYAVYTVCCSYYPSVANLNQSKNELRMHLLQMVNSPKCHRTHSRQQSLLLLAELQRSKGTHLPGWQNAWSNINIWKRIYLCPASTKDPATTKGHTTRALWYAIQGGNRERQDHNFSSVLWRQVLLVFFPTQSCFIESFDNWSSAVLEVQLSKILVVKSSVLKSSVVKSSVIWQKISSQIL